MASELEGLRRGVNTLVVLSLFALAYVARDLLLPVLAGLLIALTLRPFSRGMQRAGFPPGVAAFVLILGVTFLLLALALGSAGAVNALVDESATMQFQLKQRLRGLFLSINDMQNATKEVEDMARMGEPEKTEVVVQQPSLLNSAVSSAGMIGGTIAVALVFATFLLASGDVMLTKVVQSFPKLSDKKRALTTVYEIERNVSRYLLTITLINALLGVAVTLAMFAIGLPYPYVWGMMAFALNFLPYLGALIGAAIVAAFSVVSFDSLGYAALAPVAFLTLTTIEGQFVTPTVIGRRLSMNPIAVFLAVVLWGWLWGIAGALVAVPILVVFKVICDNTGPLKTFGQFLSGAAPVTS
ncbi:AI-2E family transporter [Oceaniglobus ichthyenteri]|uniref:AI-2E family transporter n=1 Tax=Oceaniglobus ichthyenteri TaxID=2136177 RepID=UPI000D3A81B8|nr:AI-2E family transporter [Oceaniglobus ichthyenteri]